MEKKLQKWLDEADLFIFDMDGTLYEDTEHFDYFASQLQQQLPPEKRAAFAAVYEKIKTGEHPVNVGMAYDVERDAVITVDPMTVKAKEVHDWSGRKWDKEEIQAVYPDELRFDFEKIIAIGDGWWLPQVTARHFGVSGEETVECYQQTKEFMVTEAFQLTKTSGLKDGLASLSKDKHVVLMTNSDEEDVRRLLRDLELQGLFEHIIPSAQKPAKTTKHLKALLAQYEIEPEKAISIGDNFINEIAPALLLGMKAVYIQPNPYETFSHENLLTVTSLADWFSS